MARHVNGYCNASLRSIPIVVLLALGLSEGCRNFLQRVSRFAQHAVIKAEPAQLTVDQLALRRGRGRHCGSTGRLQLAQVIVEGAPIHMGKRFHGLHRQKIYKEIRGKVNDSGTTARRLSRDLNAANTPPSHKSDKIAAWRTRKS